MLLAFFYIRLFCLLLPSPYYHRILTIILLSSRLSLIDFYYSFLPRLLSNSSPYLLYSLRFFIYLHSLCVIYYIRFRSYSPIFVYLMIFFFFFLISIDRLSLHFSSFNYTLLYSSLPSLRALYPTIAYHYTCRLLYHPLRFILNIYLCTNYPLNRYTPLTRIITPYRLNPG